MYIKDLFKFPLVCNIAVIIPFGYPAYNIITFLFINACLTCNGAGATPPAILSGP